jgi:hypothetical protein
MTPPSRCEWCDHPIEAGLSFCPGVNGAKSTCAALWHRHDRNLEFAQEAADDAVQDLIDDASFDFMDTDEMETS